VVTENLNVQPTFITGTVGVNSNRSFAISGYANTSHGKVTTNVAQTINFFNNQNFNITGTTYVQDISLGSTVSSKTTTSGGGAATTVSTQSFEFPLTVDISELVFANGNIKQTTNATQNYTSTVSTVQNSQTYTSSLVNAGQHVDTLEYDATFGFLGNTGQSSAQQYNYSDSTGAAYSCSISAAANALTAFSSGCQQ
jgi:hypothetical protein